MQIQTPHFTGTARNFISSAKALPPQYKRFLPNGIKLFKNPVDHNSIEDRGYKVLATLPNRDIYVLRKVSVTEDDLPLTMEDLDKHNLVRNFTLSKNIQIDAIQDAINSTVRIPGAHGEECGSGIILSHEGNKYLVTALHLSSVKDVIHGYKPSLSVYNKEEKYSVTKDQLIYPSVYNNKITPFNNTPLADLAIFEFNGNCPGVTLGDHNEENFIEPLFAIGFPSGEWKYLREDPSPLVSFGFAAPESSTVENIDHIDELFGASNRYYQARKWFYTGASLPGNSGSGLVDINGRLKAILCGSYTKDSDVRGYTVLYPVTNIFERVQGILAA